ncbi:hypothetical protein TRFO_15903 [Tritrichomonas foetus]|uniref:Uncharacterized protein n=1 Tax=Tritrichomonas foetus TaxID=1144522 RepID=A0A1J4KWG9_9EUKA|nr:hypothetical protein TRFO_15903 [Tritrichomonas foetus]|eukprot:OHT13877.1 hypothetical protein TRFO_15903 [Tritrichomonas foetus]
MSKESALKVMNKMVDAVNNPLWTSRDSLLLTLKRKIEIADEKAAMEEIEKFIRVYVAYSGYGRIKIALDNIERNIGDVRSKNVMDSIDYITAVSALDGSGEMKNQLKMFPSAKHPKITLPHDVKVLYGKEKIDESDIQRYLKDVISFTDINVNDILRIIKKKYPNFCLDDEFTFAKIDQKPLSQNCAYVVDPVLQPYAPGLKQNHSQECLQVIPPAQMVHSTYQTPSPVEIPPYPNYATQAPVFTPTNVRP